MKHRSLSSLYLLLAAWIGLLPSSAAAQQPCESLKSLSIPNVTITAATSIKTPPDWEAPSTPGRFGTPAGLKVSVPFCRIEAYAQPTSDSHIGFEIWLPTAANWNGKFLAVGNPGFIGSISYGGLAGALKRGYATASTDTGHLDTGYSWAVGHPEKLADWGHRAVHEMTVSAKRLMQAHFGSLPKFSYWNSCHNGGNQGLNEAQRYPEDYDGIVAGDPAYNITHLQAGSEYLSLANVKDGVKAPGYIPATKFPVIHRAVLDACDAKDGVVDGVIEDPTRCNFDPKNIQCYGSDAPSCLTAAQAETARKIYAGAKTSDGKQIYSGLEPGSEVSWNSMVGGAEPISISNSFFSYIVFGDPKWDYHTFDVGRDTQVAASKVGKAVDANDPNLKAFKERGGKLIVYQSWGETVVPPRSILDYYKSVESVMGGQRQTQDFFRTFVVPGMGMCPGFSNADAFNPLAAMEQWREKNVPPDKILASYIADGKTYKTHPVCPYPQVAIYRGSGDTNDAANFTCGVPRW
jgi:feruloyl esterase